MKPVPSSIANTYPPRGPLQQFRFETATAFTCFRCGASKKAKLISVYGADWSRRLCNGCYGRLLALYEIKAGIRPEDERAEQLAEALLSASTLEEQRQAEKRFRASERRADVLAPESARFVATAEHVAKHLDASAQLEWSPAVIGLCKAVEAEVVHRILRPLATTVSGEDLGADKSDPDIGRVAKFASDPTLKPPELGVFAHFLQTLIHSEKRRESSSLIRGFLRLAASWTGSGWVLDSSRGLHAGLGDLTKKYRNRAAHIEELSADDYAECQRFTLGAEGLLWQLIVATEPHR